MAEPDVVLITGINRFLGTHLAARLAADPAIDRVIGVDTAPPSPAALAQLGRTEFVRADIRNPLIAKMINQAAVRTVVHAALLSTPRSIGRVAMQEMNVIGTMQLLAACQRSSTVRRVVLRSTTAVYGCSRHDPAVFTEDMSGDAHDGSYAGHTAGGFAKDAVEVEAYVRGFARRRPDVAVSVLRLAPVIGPTIDNEFTRYLRGRVVPTSLGFDPRLQLLHEADAIEVLREAAATDRPGVVNVAGDGVVALSQLLRRLGRTRLPVPRPLLTPAGRVTGNRGAVDFAAEHAAYLDLGRAVDTTRLRTRFAYTPRFSTAAAAASFADARLSGPRLALTAVGVGSELLRLRRRPAT